MDPPVVEVLRAVAEEQGVPHTVGATWTNDALYRETPGKVAARRAEGCVTVEMETAALVAVARLRGVAFGQYLYAGDDVSGEAWDHRRWNHATGARQGLFELALAAVRRLEA